MTTQSILNEFRESQGWNDATLLGLLIAYLDNQASPDTLRDYLNEAATPEEYPDALTHEFNEDRSKLIFRLGPKGREELAEFLEYEANKSGAWQEAEYLSDYLANCELQWIDPSDTGDLTDAPMLGILACEDEAARENTGPYGAVYTGGDEKGQIYTPILERWAYMSYQVRSFLEDLRDTGEAVFVNSN
jgi:hypothetical protein